MIRLMSPGKVADGTKRIATQGCATHGWDAGPVCLQFLLDPAFALGSQLSETCHEEWCLANTQTAEGQMHAMALACQMFESVREKLKPSEFHDFCVACGLWAAIRDKMLPLMSFSEGDITTLEAEFDKDQTFRDSIRTLSSKDPPPAVGGATLSAWVVANVTQLKSHKQQMDARAQAAGNQLACAMLGKAEAASLNAANYVSSITLDVDMYEKAVQKLDEENSNLEQMHSRLLQAHVVDVKRFQASMQGCDVRFWHPEIRKKMTLKKDWLDIAVSEANLHRKTLKCIHGLQDEDICQVNVICLYALGTTKKQVLDAISRNLPRMKGLTLVFYLSMPKCLHRKEVGSFLPDAADGAEEQPADDSPSEGTDGDREMHDFGRDGNLLPDAITRVHAVKSSSQRAAQLAADHIDIDTAVGLADIAVRYPKRVTFLHVKDSHGDKDATLALLLIPTETEPGINTASLKEATMFQGGTFLEVPVPVTIQPITQQLAQQAKRALVDHWCFDKECPRDAGQRFSLSKTCRGQVGVELHQTWLKDLAKTCGKKCLYIVDLVCGSGEIAKACVDVKISEEASSQNVRVCSWSHDPRSSFHELAWARCGTHLGKLYLQNKLQIPGHNPVAAPGDVPRKTRKMVRALMGAPLRVLSLSGDGGLLLPDPVDVLRMCPEDEQGPIVAQFAKWRAKYPTISDAHDATETADGVSAETATAGAGSADDALAAASAAIKAGAIVEGQKHVEKSLGETIVKQEKMPPMQGAMYNKLQMVLCAKPGGGHRIWLANTSEQPLAVPTGTYLGQAGPGAFVSIATTQLTEKQTPVAWRWTRITSHKRDNAELANAFLILIKDITEPADGSKVKPKLLTMEDNEKEVGSNISLYGHSITRGGGLQGHDHSISSSHRLRAQSE